MLKGTKRMYDETTEMMRLNETIRKARIISGVFKGIEGYVIDFNPFDYKTSVLTEDNEYWVDPRDVEVENESKRT